jgi:hypothetical protein
MITAPASATKQRMLDGRGDGEVVRREDHAAQRSADPATDDAQQRGDDQAEVLPAGDYQSSDRTDDQTLDDNPDDVHNHDGSSVELSLERRLVPVLNER